MDSTNNPDTAETNNQIMLWILIIFWIFLPTVCVQFAFYLCEKKWPALFSKISWWLLCVIPPFIAFNLQAWIFLSFCTGFAVVSFIGYILARQKPLSPNTPRFVYLWFYIINWLTMTTCIIGFLTAWIRLFLSFCFGIPEFTFFMISGGTLSFYGGYFGLLGRDLAIIITETMNNKPGLYNDAEDVLPSGTVRRDCCNICKGPLNNRFDFIERNSATKDHEKWKKLECGDIFHESCLRGWVMLGKKTICPCCREKVDFLLDENKSLFGRVSSGLLVGYDVFLRYLVVYLPVTILLFVSLIRVVGLFIL